MAPDEIESQIREITEQLDLQGEAIAKLVELVSNLDGIDAAHVKSYALHLKRFRGEAVAVRKAEAPSPDPLLSAQEPSPVQEQAGAGNSTE